MNIIKKIYRKYSYQQWNIAFLNNKVDEILTGQQMDVKLMQHHVPNVWFADPFILDVTDNHIILLVEEFDEKIEKGSVSRLVVDRNSYELLEDHKILELDTHLSYPAILRSHDGIYIYPENHDSNKLILYRYDEENKFCIKDKVLCQEPLTDATITYLLGEEFLFSTKIPNPNGDILDVYKRDDVEQSFYKIQSVVFNENIARMAGDFFEYKNKIYRPAQENNHSYGHSLSIQEVSYDNKTFCFKEVVRLKSPLRRYSMGFHTLNFYKGVTVIDLKGFEYGFGKYLYQIHKLLKK